MCQSMATIRCTLRSTIAYNSATSSPRRSMAGRFYFESVDRSLIPQGTEASPGGLPSLLIRDRRRSSRRHENEFSSTIGFTVLLEFALQIWRTFLRTLRDRHCLPLRQCLNGGTHETKRNSPQQKNGTSARSNHLATNRGDAGLPATAIGSSLGVMAQSRDLHRQRNRDRRRTGPSALDAIRVIAGRFPLENGHYEHRSWRQSCDRCHRRQAHEHCYYQKHAFVTRSKFPRRSLAKRNRAGRAKQLSPPRSLLRASTLGGMEHGR